MKKNWSFIKSKCKKRSFITNTLSNTLQLEKFNIIHKAAERIIGTDIITVKFDWKSELLYVLEKYLSKKNIRVEVSTPGLTNYEGMTDIRNIKFIEMIKLMFQHITLSISFSGYALQTTSYLSNLVVDKTTKVTPFRHCLRTKHNLEHLHVWGCQVIINRVDNRRKMLLVASDLKKNGYKVYTVQRQINWLF